MSDITEKWLKELRKMSTAYQIEEMRYMECVIEVRRQTLGIAIRKPTTTPAETP